MKLQLAYFVLAVILLANFISSQKNKRKPRFRSPFAQSASNKNKKSTANRGTRWNKNNSQRNTKSRLNKNKSIYKGGLTHRHKVPVILGSHTHIHPHHNLHHVFGPYPFGVHSHLYRHKTHLSIFHLNAQKYVQMARMAYCNKNSILANTCRVCPFLKSRYTVSFVHTVNDNHKKLFQFIIFYSKQLKEIVISFSGPTTHQAKYFNKVYKKGFVTVKGLGKKTKVENYFWEIYTKYIRTVLHKKVKKLMNNKKRNSFNVILTGHSLGGSLAILAGFDLIKSKILTQNCLKTSPIVYAYGSLRIGDNNFVAEANKALRIIRIVRSDDFVTRVPSCAYDPSSKHFKCFERVASVVKHFPIFKKYFVIYRQGIKLYRRTIIKRFKVTKTTKVHYHTHFSQPLGTILFYNGNNFSTYHLCLFRNGIPTCEEKLKLPRSFSPVVHRSYFGIDLESC